MQKFRKNWLRVYINPVPIWSHYNKSLCHIDSFMILKHGGSPVNFMAITCQHYLEGEFLSLNTMEILGWIIFVVGSVLCLMGCSVSSLASTTRQSRNLSPYSLWSLDSQKCLQTMSNVREVDGGQNPTVLKYIALKKYSLTRTTALS